MTNPNFPYKPELNERKAKLFARCFLHCLQSDEISLDEDEQTALLAFIRVVGEKSEIQNWLEQLTQRGQIIDEPLDVDVRETTAQSMFGLTTHERKANAAASMSNEEDWPTESLEQFIYVWEGDSSKIEEVAAAQNELTRRREQTPTRIRPPQT